MRCAELHLKELSKAPSEGALSREGLSLSSAHRPGFILSLLFPAPFREYNSVPQTDMRDRQGSGCKFSEETFSISIQP